MGDVYSATLEVAGFPAIAITREHQPSRSGFPAYDVLSVDLDALRAHFGEESLTEIDAGVPVSRERLEIAERWDRLAERLSYLGIDHAEEVAFTASGKDPERGVLSLTDSLSGGTYSFDETGVLDALREAGLAYFASDDGHYSNDGGAGSWAAWQPGWPAERAGQHNGCVTLGLTEYVEILSTSPTLAEVARRVGSHLRTREEVLGLEPALRPELLREVGPPLDIAGEDEPGGSSVRYAAWEQPAEEGPRLCDECRQTDGRADPNEPGEFHDPRCSAFTGDSNSPAARIARGLEPIRPARRRGPA